MTMKARKKMVQWSDGHFHGFWDTLKMAVVKVGADESSCVEKGLWSELYAVTHANSQALFSPAVVQPANWSKR